MTGFGEASEHDGGARLAVELRSLNNRYFKASIRLPDEIAGLEAELETLLRHRLSRGSITLVVKMNLIDTSFARQINDSVLNDYLGHLSTIQSRVKGEGRSVNIDLTALLALPGVMTGLDEAELLRKVRPVVMRLSEQACDKLSAMRQTEGKALADDLLKHRAFILERLAVIRERAPVVVEEYHARLKVRIGELMRRAELKTNELDLIREVAIFADRSDISEEISRLGGHLEQIERIIAQSDGEPAGRTLDFLAQELLREANTIASKSNDAQISRAIVEVKGAIDRIKEQVQNVE